MNAPAHAGIALEDLRAAVLAPTLPAELVPPPRFSATTFASYRTDPAFPEQGVAVARVQAFATAPPARWWAWWRRHERPGLYLDGGFGVGKTHLLAASFHAARGQRRYLSFAEAVGLVVLHGVQRAADVLRADLVCIDEFELDDPANTRLIDLLLEALTGRGARIVTTSNTVPGELGVGRMAVDQFRNQLTRIAERFADVHIPGQDHRRRGLAAAADPARWSATLPRPAPGALIIAAPALDALLADLPIVNLRRLAARLPALAIDGVAPFTDQLIALRFVNLVDKLYDFAVPLAVAARCPIAGLFPEEHCQRAFAKKYQRCQSRLAELCA